MKLRVDLLKTFRNKFMYIEPCCFIENKKSRDQFICKLKMKMLIEKETKFDIFWSQYIKNQPVTQLKK